MHFPCYYNGYVFHFIQLPGTRTIYIPAIFATNKAMKQTWEKMGEGLQKVDSNMAPSETFIRDRGISVL